MTDRAGQAFGGLGVADGIAIGPAHVVEGGSDRVVEYRVSASDVAAEIRRFGDATAAALEQLVQLRRQSEHIGGAAGEEMGYLLAAHASMLEGSRLTRGVEAAIRDRRVNAEAAVEAEISRIARQFSAIADPYLAARGDDVRDLGRRLIRTLGGARTEPFAGVAPGSVVIAHEVTPADTAAMAPGKVAGIVAEIGGADGHTAILARGLGLPAVLGVSDLLESVNQGDMVIVDGKPFTLAGVAVGAVRDLRLGLVEQRRVVHSQWPEDPLVHELAKQLAGYPLDDRDQHLVARIAVLVALAGREEGFAPLRKELDRLLIGDPMIIELGF